MISIQISVFKSTMTPLPSHAPIPLASDLSGPEYGLGIESLKIAPPTMIFMHSRG